MNRVEVSCVLFYLMLFFVSNSYAVAKSDSTNINPNPNLAYFKSCFIDVKDIAISPIKWKTKDYLTFGGVVAAAALLYTQDEAINSFMLKNQNKVLQNTSKYFLEPTASGVYSMPAMAILYLGGYLTHNDKLKKTSLLALKAIGIATGETYILKNIFHRRRPYELTPPRNDIFNMFDFDNKSTSFPSGHSTAVFALATVFATEYSNNKVVVYSSYTIASLCAIARSYDNKHWASDILIGSALGYASAKLICRKNNWKVNIIPYTQPTASGVNIRISI